MLDAALNSQTDAFDGFGAFAVGGSMLNNPDGTVDVSSVFGGTALSTDAQVLSGLNVLTQYYADDDTEVLRALIRLENTGGSQVDTEVRFGGTGGSWSGQIDTSSGDGTVSAADRWVIMEGAFDDPDTTFAQFDSSTVRPR